jgi:23S rRNA pseudouridine2457 synthase
MPESVVHQLRNGVEIRIRGGGYWVSSPCEADLVSKPLWLPSRIEEIPEFVPHCWLTISLTEGKFHQVRKMLMAVRHKCKRLIRVSIEDLDIQGFQSGEVREIPEAEFFEKLRLGDVMH